MRWDIEELQDIIRQALEEYQLLELTEDYDNVICLFEEARAIIEDFIMELKRKKEERNDS